jgi:hypothetical protein
MIASKPCPASDSDLIIAQAIEKFDRQINESSAVQPDPKHGGGDHQPIRCPYCGLADSCEHLLLELDTSECDSTGSVPVGGAIQERFSNRLVELLNDEGLSQDIDDRRRIVEHLLEEIQRIARTLRIVSGDAEDGDEKTYYFCASKDAVAETIKAFDSLL